MAACVRGPLTTTPVDYSIQHYVFPCQLALLGMISYSNLKNIIFNKSRMVAKPSLFILTITNIFILLSMLPQCMGSYSIFYENEAFRRFFHYTKISISALSNYFSAVEIYLTVTIAAECYLRAKSSSLVQVFQLNHRYFILLVTIFVSSALLTAYHFVLYELITAYRCDGTKLVVKIKLNTDFLGLNAIRTLNCVQAVAVIIIPTLVIIALNAKHARIVKGGKYPNVSNECEELFSTPDCVSMHKKRIIVFLPAISFCFTLSHMLSFLPFLGDIFPSLYEKGFPIVISVVNSVLITGKILILALISRTCLELSKCGMFVTY